jgi:hypothetical protein
LVDTGDSRSPTTLREYKSNATVSSTLTQRSVTGSIANTSSGVESNSTNSPGRVGRSRPYAPLGRLAIDRLPLVEPTSALVPRLNSVTTARARRRPGSATTPSPYCARSRAAMRASTRLRVGRLASTCSSSTSRHIASHRGSTPASGSALRSLRPSTRPPTPRSPTAAAQRRSVRSLTPSSAALAR